MPAETILIKLKLLLSLDANNCHQHFIFHFLAPSKFCDKNIFHFRNSFSLQHFSSSCQSILHFYSRWKMRIKHILFFLIQSADTRHHNGLFEHIFETLFWSIKCADHRALRKRDHRTWMCRSWYYSLPTATLVILTSV